jgi:hypothetical protein
MEKMLDQSLFRIFPLEVAARTLLSVRARLGRQKRRRKRRRLSREGPQTAEFLDFLTGGSAWLAKG